MPARDTFVSCKQAGAFNERASLTKWENRHPITCYSLKKNLQSCFRSLCKVKLQVRGITAYSSLEGKCFMFYLSEPYFIKSNNDRQKEVHMYFTHPSTTPNV